MKTDEIRPSVPEFRIQAKRLLKQLRSDSSADAAVAADRFRRLRSFSSRTTEEILKTRDRVRLKHALTVLAVEHGHESWSALKASMEALPAVAPGREMYAPGLDVFLNRWFASYDDARQSLEEQGGYLLPFDRQFFICEKEAIRVLGLDPDDADWQRIGWDGARPRDPRAWQQLRRKRAEVLRKSTQG